MREQRLSGSMRGNRKQSYVKPDCGGAAKGASIATGRLPPLRLFSTLHLEGTNGFFAKRLQIGDKQVKEKA